MRKYKTNSSSAPETAGVEAGFVSGQMLAQHDDGIYVRVGDIVDNKYQVVRVLGEGAMGFVLAAKHLQLDELVALKFLHRQYLGVAQVAERFAREAKASCKIKSEYVARVHDVGVHDGAPFLVMEHLVGSDLATVLSNEGPLDVADAVEYTMQACEALAVAHANGIVHRDIKPENIFLVDQDGLRAIKILDFGISKIALTEMDPGLTANLSLGTPLYMSPEQIRSARSVDQRSDIWALGIVLYELLTAQMPFTGDGLTEVCAAILEHEPPHLDQMRSDMPFELGNVVARCLEKNPEKRFQNVAELAVALLRFAPKRARVSAERSSSVVRAASPAGTVHSALYIPSTFPPPSILAKLEDAPLPSIRPLPSISPTETPVKPAGLRPFERFVLFASIAVVLFCGGALAKKFLLDTSSPKVDSPVTSPSPVIAAAVVSPPPTSSVYLTSSTNSSATPQPVVTTNVNARVVQRVWNKPAARPIENSPPAPVVETPVTNITSVEPVHKARPDLGY